MPKSLGREEQAETDDRKRQNGVDFVEDETGDAERKREMIATEARDARTEQASRLMSIGQLAGGISHDFNNLLAVILTNSELALETLGPGSEVSDELEEIISAAGHAAKLTRQLLVFSRHKAMPRELVDLSTVVSDMEQLLRRSLGERIELEVRLNEDLPPVLADPSQMEQVVLNLTINARDSMPNGGRLGIATKVAELDAEYASEHPEVVAGDYVRLTIADDGAGMPEHVQEQAFEPFFTTKGAGEGTGLGLSTVYAIIKQYDGHIGIYSEENTGTVVRVHLPIASDAIADQDGVARHSGAKTTQDAPARPIEGMGQIVLVVEDSDAVRRGAIKILVKNGYRTLEADRGAKALALIAETEVDLVLTDLVMPKMLGTELDAILAKTHPKLPVVFMSGYADVAGPIENTERLLEKPFTSAKLLAIIQRALAGELMAGR